MQLHINGKYSSLNMTSTMNKKNVTAIIFNSGKVQIHEWMYKWGNMEDIMVLMIAFKHTMSFYEEDTN